MFGPFCSSSRGGNMGKVIIYRCVFIRLSVGMQGGWQQKSCNFTEILTAQNVWLSADCTVRLCRGRISTGLRLKRVGGELCKIMTNAPDLF